MSTIFFSFKYEKNHSGILYIDIFASFHGLWISGGSLRANEIGVSDEMSAVKGSETG